jgi:hypothetical protein
LFTYLEQPIQSVPIKRHGATLTYQAARALRLCFFRNQERTMINKSKLALIAVLAAITFASPAFAQSIPGYAADGGVVALGQASNVQQKAEKTVSRRGASFGSATNASGIPGYGPDGNVVTLGQ